MPERIDLKGPLEDPSKEAPGRWIPGAFVLFGATV
jgi:hypothetical protein